MTDNHTRAQKLIERLMSKEFVIHVPLTKAQQSVVRHEVIAALNLKDQDYLPVVEIAREYREECLTWVRVARLEGNTLRRQQWQAKVDSCDAVLSNFQDVKSSSVGDLPNSPHPHPTVQGETVSKLPEPDSGSNATLVPRGSKVDDI